MADSARQVAETIVRRLVAAGHQAYFVGGCVRDLLLGREPTDYDVSTDATPDEVMRLFANTVAVGAQFGVVLVAEDSTQVEVATFRADGRYTDGRHPDEVRFARQPEEDVRRRDFTVNGLLFDPLKNECLDFVGGREDIRRGVIRTIGEPKERLGEDKLRMLRAVRFAARFGYTIEPDTFAAIRELREQVRVVSTERIRDEILKMLTEPHPRRAFELLDETGLLEVVLPEVARMKGVAQPPEFHPEGDVWVHTLLMLEKMDQPRPTLALGVLLHDVGKPPTFRPASGGTDRIRFDDHTEVGARMAEEICRRLRLSNPETEQVVALVRNHLRFKDVPRMKSSTLKRFVRMERFEEHLELHRLDCMASHGDLTCWEFVHRFLAETPVEEIRPLRLLTGDDLVAMGYRPGPEFKKILAAVEEAQLEGQLASREAAMRFVAQRFPLGETHQNPDPAQEKR